MEVRNRVYVPSMKSKFEVSLGSLKCEVRMLKWEVGKSGSREVGSRKSEVESRKSEVGSRKSEVGSRKSEVGSRKSSAASPSSVFVRERACVYTRSKTGTGKCEGCFRFQLTSILVA